jgi:hypothetical protein
MSINKISQEIVPFVPARGTAAKSEGKVKESPKDKVELSEEAKALLEADQKDWIKRIRDKIQRGFYFQREVSEKIADEMLNDLMDAPAA